MEPEASWKNNLIPCLLGSKQLYQVNKEGHLLAGAEISVYSGGFEKSGIHPNL